MRLQHSFRRKRRGTGEKTKHSRAAQFSARRTREYEFEQLYLQSYGLVYGYVRARMSSDADAEDVVSEAYLKAARSFSSFDPSRAKFSTWMVTIARNCMISYFRKAHPTTAIEGVPESAVAVQGEQKSVDDRDLALRLLAVLDETERELVLCRYRDDMRNVDIARHMGMNESTVSTKLSKALAIMRHEAEK